MAKNNITAKNDGGVKKSWYGLKEFFIGVYMELKKVHWPNRKQIMVYTGVVMLMVIIVMIIIWVFDLGLSYFLSLLNERFRA